MKSLIFKVTTLFFASVVMLALSGCGSEGTSTEYGAIGDSEVTLKRIELTRDDAYKSLATENSKKFIQGTSIQGKATGFYSDGTSKDITNNVVWSETGDVFTVSKSGLLTAYAPGNGDVIAILDNVEAKVSGEVIAATLVSVNVTGSNESPVGRDIQLQAIALFDVGISVDVTNDAAWTSTNTDIKVENGLVNSKDVAASDVTATFEDAGTPPVTVTSSAHPVNFTNEVLDHLEIQKNGGTSCQGEPINGIKQTLELVDKVSYPSDPDGLSPNAFYPTVCEVYTNGTKVYVNQDAIWRSSDQQVAQVNYIKGSFVFGTDIGTDVIISANHEGLEATFPVDVIVQQGGTLESIFITNSWNQTPVITALAMEVGDKTPVVAWGNYSYSDGRPDAVKYINANVAWTSSDLGVAWIFDALSSDVSALSVGSSEITATWQGVSAIVDVSVSVTSAYTSIELQKSYQADGDGEILDSTNPLEISQGQVQYITAWGVKSDGTKEYINTEVLWSSDNQAIAAMDLAQRNSNVTGVAVGTANLTAAAGGFTGTTPINVISDTGILKSNIRWEKDASITGLPGNHIAGKTASIGHSVSDRSTAVWYFARVGQGYSKDTTIDKINFSFAATLDGSISGVHVNVYMYDEAGNKVKANIFNDADWINYQSAYPTYVIRTDYYERSEGEVVQSNFVLRLGDSSYKGKDKDFTIDKFELSTTP